MTTIKPMGAVPLATGQPKPGTVAPKPMATMPGLFGPAGAPAAGPSLTPGTSDATSRSGIGPMTTGTTATPQATPGAPAPQAGAFGPGNNLIGQQFSPGTSERGATAAGYTNTAAQSLANFSPAPFNLLAPANQSGANSQYATANQQMQGLSTQGYRPVGGTDLSGARGQLGAANSAVGNSAASGYAGAGQTGGFAYGGDTQQVRGMGLDQLKNVLNTTPDRATLANSAFQRLLDESNPQFESELRSTNARNAAMGRRGSGMSTQDLGTVQQRREEALMRERGRLADDAAGLTLSDAQSKLAAAQGFGSELAGQDTAAGSLNLGYQNSNNAERGAAFDRMRALGNDTFGQRMSLADAERQFAGIDRQDGLTERNAMNDAERYGNSLTAAKSDASQRYGDTQYRGGRDAYNDAYNERDAQFGYDQAQFGNRRNALNDSMGFENFVRGNERSDRNELRGERDYQYGLSRDAQGDRINQELTQEQLYGQEFDRGRQLTDIGYGTGDPYGAYRDAAGDAGQRSSDAYGAGMDLLGTFGQRRGRGQVDPRASGARPSALDTFRAPNFDI